MIIETVKVKATKSVVLKTADGTKRLEAGGTLEAPYEKLRPHIEKGLFVLVDKSETPRFSPLKEGETITWKSPILGVLSGKILLIDSEHGRIFVEHPLNDGRYGPASIPIEWVF